MTRTVYENLTRDGEEPEVGSLVGVTRESYFASLLYREQLDIMPDELTLPNGTILIYEKDYSICESVPLFKFKTEPFAHQLKAFNMLKDEEFLGLFMDMGTGKTKTAIDIATYKYLKGDISAVQIIAPNHVHEQWLVEQYPIHCSIDYKTFKWVSGKQHSRMFGGMLKRFTTEPLHGVLKVFGLNVEAFQSDSILPTVGDYVHLNNVFTIIDESTRIKTPTAKRSMTIHRLEKWGHRAILTGTPTAKSPFDLYSQFEFLKKDYFNCNYFIFKHKYGVMMKGTNEYTGHSYQTLIDEKTFAIVKSKLKKMKESRNGKLMPDDYLQVSIMCGVSEKNVRFIEKQKVFARYKRLDELKELIAPITFSIKKSECLDLPPKIYEVKYIDMTKDQRRIYSELKKHFLVKYDGVQLSVQHKIVVHTRLMQICGGFLPYDDEEDEHITHIKMIGETKKTPKLVGLREDLEETEGKKIIIWARFVAELEMLYAELSKEYNCALYYGGTNQLKRKYIIEDFKAGKIDIFIGNLQTAGFGLNLQLSTLQYFYSNSFATELRLQGEDRSHRYGVLEACVYKDMICKNSIEEKILHSIREGRDLNDYFKSNSIRDLLENGE